MSSQRDKPWRLGRIDIRAPVSATAWPVARVELEHGERGRTTDIASAPGELDAAFSAVGKIIGLDARVLRLEMQYAAGGSDELTVDERRAMVVVEISIEVDSNIFVGRARECDILTCCVAAFIDAASNAEAVRRVRAENADREWDVHSGGEAVADTNVDK